MIRVAKDLGTEDMRWMGDARFTVGYVQGALARRTYPVELAVKVIAGGVDKMALGKEYNDALARPPPSLPQAAGDVLPELQFGTVGEELPAQARERVHDVLPEQLEEGWHTIKTPVQFVYGGKLPFIAKDTRMFPPAAGNDGTIDLAIVGPVSRMEALTVRQVPLHTTARQG